MPFSRKSALAILFAACSRRPRAGAARPSARFPIRRKYVLVGSAFNASPPPCGRTTGGPQGLGKRAITAWSGARRPLDGDEIGPMPTTSQRHTGGRRSIEIKSGAREGI